MVLNKLRARLHDKATSYGLWVTMESPTLTEIAGALGVDWVCVDMEHGHLDFREVMEHVQHWRPAISNLKRLVKPNGVLLITTRSRGFPYHGYPYDFWRYEVQDMRAIFSDMTIDVLETDPVSPGVFIKVHKPATFVERELDSIDLYSIVAHRRCREVTSAQIYVRRIRHKVRRALSRLLPKNILAGLDRIVTREEAPAVQGRGAR